MWGVRFGISRVARKLGRKSKRSYINDGVPVPSTLLDLFSSIRLAWKTNQVYTSANFQKTVEILQKNSRFTFRKDQLFLFQTALIEIWTILLEILELERKKEQYDVMLCVIRLLKCIVVRRELNLPINSSTLMEGNNKKKKHPLEFAVRYRLVLDRTFTFVCQNSTTSGSHTEMLRDLAAFTLSCLVFRRMDIQTEMYRCLIEGLAARKWKGPRYAKPGKTSLRRDSRLSTESLTTTLTLFEQTNPTFFQWHLINENIDSLMDDNNVIEERSALVQMVVQDAAFMILFATYYTQQVVQCGMGHIRWKQLPLYEPLCVIVQHLITEATWRQYKDVVMKEDSNGILRPVHVQAVCNGKEKCAIWNYTYDQIPALLKGCSSWMCNPNQLTPMVKALLRSTDVRNRYSVPFSLSHISHWLDVACEGTVRIPYGVLPIGELIPTITRCLDSEHVDILTSTLLFLYRSLHQVDGATWSLCWDVLLGHFRLFIHWNAQVRAMYHFLLVYHLYNGNRIVFWTSTSGTINTDRMFVTYVPHPSFSLDNNTKNVEESKQWKEGHVRILDFVRQYKCITEGSPLEYGSISETQAPYLKPSISHYAQLLTVYYKMARVDPKGTLQPPELSRI